MSRDAIKIELDDGEAFLGSGHDATLPEGKSFFPVFDVIFAEYVAHLRFLLFPALLFKIT